MKAQEYIDLSPDVAQDRQKIINRTLNKWRKATKPKDTKELLIRLDMFFKTVEELQIVPSEKLLCLCLGISRTTMFRHKNGLYCTQEWCDALNRAADLIETQIELATSEGRLNPIYSIWIQKSRYGYSDQAGKSERERLQQQVGSQLHYRLPQDILAEYQADDTKTEEAPIPLWLTEEPKDSEVPDWMYQTEYFDE